jgi:hypothetical protein
MALKPCLDCGALTDQARCPTHRAARNRERDAERGGTTARAYGTQHQQRRAQLLPLALGQPCARCLEVMLPSQSLDLDHSDPEDKKRGLPGDRITHSACNRGGRTPSVTKQGG